MLKIVNPYPGFESGFYRPYTEEEYSLFFGRERDISALKLKIRQRRLVSLIADEKMGKTSLLRGGLIPNLRNHPFDGYIGNEWKCVYMMPDQKPILALAKALVNPSNKLSEKIKPSMEEEVYNQLLKNDYGLVRVAESIIGDRGINILLVVDDFIDVFEKNVDPKERMLFLRLLHKLYIDTNVAMFIVASFNREDFKDNRLRAEPKLHKALNMGIHKMKFLDDVGLMKAIDEPAKLANSTVASDLSSEMMLMLLQDNDQLRKLQLLMSRTWLEWKRNHKDKVITKAHYFRATGQKSKAVAKGLMKGGKVSVDHLESLAKESAKADNSEMAKADYNKLDAANKLLFKKIIPHLLDDSGKNFKAVSIDRKQAGDLIGVSMEDLGILVTQIPTILAMDKKKLSINDISIFENWDEIKEWVRNSNSLKLKFEQIAEAAILHYIDGIDLESVISRHQYKEQFKYVDLDLMTPSWAMAQHEHYELGLDFIQKLQETYGKLEVQTKSATTFKKLTFGSKKEVDNDKEAVVQTSSSSQGTSDDEEARKEALKILGIQDEEVETRKEVNEDEFLGESPDQEEENILETKDAEIQAPLDDEDEAIRKLLGEEPNSRDQEVLSHERVRVETEKQSIEIKAKPKIVLKSKDSSTKEESQNEGETTKPKIIIKKKD